MKMASLDKASLNNQIVLMRPDIKMAKLYTINKLVKEIRLLRKRNVSEASKNKYFRKSERLIEEIKIIKKLKCDEVSKFILSNEEDLLSIINNPESEPRMKALGKVCRNNVLKTSLFDFKKKYPNWSSEISLLLPQLGRRIKKKTRSDNLKENLYTEENVGTSSKNKTIHTMNNKVVSTPGNKAFLVQKIIKKESGEAKNGINKGKISGENKIYHEFPHNEVSKSDGQKNKTDSEEKVKNLRNEPKVVDPFFMTGENTEYLTVVTSEKQIEALNNTNEDLKNKSNSCGSFQRFSNNKNSNFSEKINYKDREKGFNKVFERKNYGKEKFNFRKDKNHTNFKQSYETKFKVINEEKLHPSWEAKKKQSTLTQFVGKKIVFNDND